MTPSEYYTYQFYTWEFRGRGWFLADQPVQLEPPFIPFKRKRFNGGFVDDGKSHTLLSFFAELFKGRQAEPQTALKFDYEEIEPYIYDRTGALEALQVKVSKERRVSPDRMKALLVMLSTISDPISYEILGTGDEIVHQFVSDAISLQIVETYLNAYFPELQTSYISHYVEGIFDNSLQTRLIDFGLEQEFIWPIQISRSFGIDPLTAFYGVLESLKENQQAGIQILFSGALNKWAESITQSVTLSNGESFFEDTPHAPKLALEKAASPLFGITIRTFAQAQDDSDTIQIISRLIYAIQTPSIGAVNKLVPLPDEVYTFELRARDILFRESHRLGMLLNTDELITLLHFPSESITSKKLFKTSRKTRETPVIAKGKEFVLGINTHNGLKTEVTLSMQDRLKHTHIIGATGTGKSTLLANLISQDISKGHSVVLFDPHGDLIVDIIAGIPDERLNDVLLIDPSDTDFPIGLNILEAHSDIEKEVLSSDLVATFKRYATSWGDQMSAVLGNAIQAILENPAGGTLNDLRRFLIENDFRKDFLKGVNDPAILYYWQKEYSLLKSNSIGPILTRLDTFLRPRSIRNMVIQKTGLDFEALLNNNKILLFKLSQGLIGAENSFILGSLVLSKIHQAMFRRQQHHTRKPVLLYLDEFQHFITPSIQGMLSGIRKYNVGLTLSHQDLMQLQKEDVELANSVLGNVHTRVVFRVGEPDAKKLQDGFANFTYSDLQNLGRGEAIIKIEQPQYDCSLETFPADTVVAEKRESNLQKVISHTRAFYATRREEVERELFESFSMGDSSNKETVEPPPTRRQQPNFKANNEPESIPFEEIKAEENHAKDTTIEREQKQEKDISTHRYLQTLVKKMAEARGYTATVENQLPDGSGQVDVLLIKEGTSIAVEICNTTNAEWEMHNIQKCLEAGYNQVISLSGDPKQLDKIKGKCQAEIADFTNKPVLFLTPDALFAYLDTTSNPSENPHGNVIKGYRVNVTYDSVSHEEMQRKREAVAKVVFDSLKKKKRGK